MKRAPNTQKEIRRVVTRGAPRHFFFFAGLDGLILDGAETVNRANTVLAALTTQDWRANHSLVTVRLLWQSLEGISSKSVGKKSSEHPEMPNIKVGVVGAGRILAAYLEASKHSGIEIAALCDPCNPALPKGTEELPLFADFREMAKMPELDAFIIAVPSSLHFEVAQLALEAGRPLLIEKPVALKPAQFEQLRDIAGAKGTPVFSLLHAQYGAEVIAARDHLLKLKAANAAPVSIDWHTLICDPYEGNSVVLASLINAWVDGGINAISIILATLSGAQITRVSGSHAPEKDENWAQQKSRQVFELTGAWTGTATLEIDFTQGHGIKASNAKLDDGSQWELHHTNEALAISGSSHDVAHSFQNATSRLANHYIGAFDDALEHIKQGRSNWDFSHACHSAYFSCFP